eukprot:scaffold44608_cov87-Cyclotella_meneghiniana.AAC.9
MDSSHEEHFDSVNDMSVQEQDLNEGDAGDDHEASLIESALGSNNVDPEVINFVQTNPMMDRVRLTLREQLLQTRDRVRQELKLQEDELKKAKREREDAGIELYGVQQQLARLQSNLKAVDNRYDQVSKERIENQAKAAAAKKRYAERLKEAEKLGKEESKSQEELDAMLGKVRQAKKYNEAMKSEVAVTRTVANKTEEDLKAKAKDKLMQDNYIDSLNTQVARLEDEIALTEAQLKAQKEQSVESESLIRETSNALEKLASEQRRLVQQWNSSVVALGRRDQALSAATNALKKVQDSIKDLESENARFRRDIEALEHGNENLRITGDRLDNEIAFTDSKIAKVQSNLGTLSEKFEMLQELLQNTIQEEHEIDADIKKIQSEMVSASHKCELLIRERQAIEDKITTSMHERASMSKAAQNLAKQEKSMLTKIHDKEIESASIMNEIARLDLDRLNTQAHNAQLQAKLDEELEALKATEARIDVLEGAFKRCNDEIEIKTKRVAKLNREYNKMVDSYEGEEPTGPLEATIKSLANEIEQEGSQIRALQKEWLMRQTELIKIISKTNEIQEEDSKSTARLSILKQKALRLVQNIHTNEAALKSIEFNTRSLHTDITRLNDLIEQNSRHRIDLANKIAVNAMEFERELAELEEQSVCLEVQITDVKIKRDTLIDEMSEVESQIKEWEKKIQIEKDTQAELHTSKDAIDTKGMKKEIQKMKHRLESLVRVQEQLLRDMELAIHKREDIAIKYKNTKYSGSTHNQNLTKGELAKKVETAKAKLKRLDDSMKEAISTMASTQDDLDAVKLLLGDVESRYESASKMLGSLQSEVKTKNFERARLQSMIELQDELFKRYEGELPVVQKASKREEFAVEREYVVSRRKLDSVCNIITGLALKFHRYEDVFDRMNLLASDVLVGESCS